MKVSPVDLPQNYSSIFTKTTGGYVITKLIVEENIAFAAFTDESLNILHEIKFEKYKRHDNKFAVNPKNTKIIGYLHNESCLQLVDIDNNIVREFECRCVAAEFDSAGRLFIANRIDSNNIEICVYNDNYDLITAQTVNDPIYESYVDFEFYPRINQMFLSLAGGQDGSMYCSVNLNDNTLVLTHFIDDSIFVETDKDNKHFLSIDPYSSVANYYTYPDKNKIRSFDYYDYFGEGDLNCVVVYLKEEYFIIGFEGKMYIYNAGSGKVKEEIVVEGHESKPISFFYPNLKDKGEMTDIVSAQRFGDLIGFTSHYERGFYVKIEDIISQL